MGGTSNKIQNYTMIFLAFNGEKEFFLMNNQVGKRES